MNEVLTTTCAAAESVDAADLRSDELYRLIRTRSPAAERHVVLSQADREWRRSRWRVTDPDLAYLPLIPRCEVDVAAARLRALMNLDRDPIPSMLDILDRLNIIVGEMPEGAPNTSAFSCWYDDQPLVLVRGWGLNGRRRTRFDTAHELGHVLLHHDVDLSGREEREADQFAGALLIPSVDILGLRYRPFSWLAVERLAEWYDVTVLAALYRIHELGGISDVVFGAAFVDAARKGWRRADPLDRKRPELSAWSSRRGSFCAWSR